MNNYISKHDFVQIGSKLALDWKFQSFPDGYFNRAENDVLAWSIEGRNDA